MNELLSYYALLASPVLSCINIIIVKTVSVS